MHDLPPIGTKLGSYEIEATLGDGGVATVFLARHRVLGSQHAVKLLHLPAPSVRRRLLLEGQIQATIGHPNVVAATDTVTWHNYLGLVLEYVDGPTLSSFADGRALSLQALDRIAGGLLAGVSAVHRSGYLHRDLKPDNVLMAHRTEGWIPRLADFGLARQRRRQAGRTRAGVCMGTAAYMAPEQIRDAAGVDERADVWSLGCILYELATGRRPFDGADDFATMTAVASEGHVPVSELRTDLRPGMVEAIEAALRKDPAERPTSVAELAVRWASEGPRRPRGAKGRRGRTGHLGLLVRPTRRPTPSHLSALLRAGAARGH